MIHALFIAVLLLIPFGSADADHIKPEEGKRYWIIDSSSAYRNSVFFEHWNFARALHLEATAKEGRSFILKGKDERVYSILLDDGIEHAVSLKTADAAFKNHVIVDYDPVQRAKDEAEAAERSRLQAIKSKKWSPAVERTVIDKKIRIGLTAEQTKLSWGEPERINRTVNARGVTEQWIYGSSYLYFENGVLRSWQDSR